MPQKLRQDLHIGKNIRALRNRSRLTQEETVAQMQLQGLSISRSVYAQIESGTYNIRISEIVAMKKIFAAEYADFFSDLD